MAEISIQEYSQQIEDRIEQGRYAEAVAHGKHILKQYPKHAATYQLLGKAMLEAGQDEYATDMFRRVLSADPEDLIAWVGMSEIHTRRNELDTAVWYMERAYEMAADNKAVEEELRRLYGRRDGVETQRVHLTRGALARLYLKGDLLSRAINELRELVTEAPDRVDLQVALAEALWRNEQRLEAADVCQQVLNVLPYCLKANLIMGEVWTSSGREEGEVYLRRAEAVDPENQMAQELFGATSPLIAREARIVPLEYVPPPDEERPVWMTEVDTAAAGRQPWAEGEVPLIEVPATLQGQIEIPAWLEEAVGEDASAPAPPSATQRLPGVTQPLGAETLEEAPAEVSATPEVDEVPEWLRDIDRELAERPETVIEEEAPDWLAELGITAAGGQLGDEEEAAEYRAQPLAVADEPPEAPTATDEEDVPEWLTELDIEVAHQKAVSPEPSAEQQPDWLADIRGQLSQDMEPPEEAAADTMAEEAMPAWLEGEGMRPGAAEVPDWLQELAPPEAGPAEAAPPAWEAAISPAEERLGPPTLGEPEAPPEAAAAIEEAPQAEEASLAGQATGGPPMPAWLEGEGLPSGDDALAWLEQLAAGKEEELQAQAQAEAEVRMAEIMGRTKPAEASATDSGEAPAPVPAPEEAAAPPAEETFGWTAFGEAEAPLAQEAAPEEAVVPQVPPEAAAVAEEAPPVEEGALAPPEEAGEIPMPAWLEGEGLPSGDDALAWLEQLAAGKEEELQAQAQAEAEVRMAEIMGRTKPAEASAIDRGEAPASVPTPEEAAAPPVEETFGWTAFGEAEAPLAQEAAPEEAAIPLTEEFVAPSAEETFAWPPPEAAAAMEEAPPLEEAPAAAEAAEGTPMPAWLEGEGLPSGDDALAWLEQLAEGKEEELQAQAEAEAEARMAEIMGRPKPAEAIITDRGKVTAPVPPPEEAVAPLAEEAFGWTAFGEAEAPPPQEAAPEEAAIPPTEEFVTPPAEETVTWPAFGEPEVPPESAAVAEKAPPAEEEEEAPPEVSEMARPERVKALPAAEEVSPPVQVHEPDEIRPPEEVPGAVEMELARPPEEMAAPPEIPSAEAPAEPFGAERAYLKKHQRDYEAWLALARAQWQAGERDNALEAYTRVIRAGKMLEIVIPDLERRLEQWPDASIQRVLGDAYMKDGQLQEALEIYRRALETL